MKEKSEIALIALCIKKAVALCNNEQSHFVIKQALALSNKLEMDGRRTSNNNNNNDNNNNRNNSK